MPYIQAFGVKHLAPDQRLQSRTSARQSGRAFSVDLIAKDRQTLGGQVHANLMRPAGAYFYIKITDPGIKIPDQFIIRQGLSSMGGVYRHFLTPDCVAPDGRIDSSFQFSGPTDTERGIKLLHPPAFESLHQSPVRNIIFRHNHYSGRILVQPVDDAWADLAPNAGQIVTNGQQSVDKGPIFVSGRRMNDQTGRFVHPR